MSEPLSDEKLQEYRKLCSLEMRNCLAEIDRLREEVASLSAKIENMTKNSALSQYEISRRLLLH